MSEREVAVKPLDWHRRGIARERQRPWRGTVPGQTGTGRAAETGVNDASADVQRPDIPGWMTRSHRPVAPAERHAARARVPLRHTSDGQAETRKPPAVESETDPRC